MGISLSGLTESSSGALTLSAASGQDILIGNGTTQLYVDGGTDTLGIGAAAAGNIGVRISQSITASGTIAKLLDVSGTITAAADNDQLFGLDLAGSTVTYQTTGSDFDPLIAAQIRVGGGAMAKGNSGTIATAAALYVLNAPSIGAANYALFVDGGAVRFDDRTFSIGGVNYEFPASVNAGTYLKTDGSGNLSWAAATATATGSGTTGKLTKWTDGGAGSIGDSALAESGSKIGIGTTDPDGDGPNNADNFVIKSASHAGMTILTGNTSVGSLRFGDTDSNDRGTLGYLHASTAAGTLMYFNTEGTTKRMVIDGDGKVGIINTAPSSSHPWANDLVIGTDSSSTSGMTFMASTSGTSSIYFAESTTLAARYAGWISYSQSQQRMDFGTSTGDPNAGARSIRLSGGATPTMLFAGATTIQTEASHLTLYSATNSDVLIGDGSATLQVKGNGNQVGVGVSPSYLFHVYGGSSGASASSPSNLVVEHNTSQYITMLAPNNSVNIFAFGSAASGRRGAILYGGSTHSTYPDMMVFRTTGDNDRMFIDSDGTVGIGAAPSTSKVYIRDVSAVNENALYVYHDGSAASNTEARTVVKFKHTPKVASTTTSGEMTTVQIETSPNTSTGYDFTGEVIGLKMDFPWTSTNGGVIGSGYNIKLNAPTNTVSSGALGTMTNFYQLYVGDANAVNATNEYGIYQAGATDKNYFAGNVGIGTTAPSMQLHINKADAEAAMMFTRTDSSIAGNNALGIIYAGGTDDAGSASEAEGFTAIALRMEADGTWDDSHNPTRFVFQTTPDTALNGTTPSYKETRMTIASTGVLISYGVGGTSVGNNPNRTVKFFDNTTSGSAVQANVGAGLSLGGIAKFSGLEYWDFASLRSYKDNATDDDVAGGLIIHTRDNTTRALVERMRVTSAGDVGIGVTPTNPRGADSNLNIGVGTGSLTLGDTTGSNKRWVVTNSGTGGVSFGIRRYATNGDLDFEALHIDTAGKVGIGTTAPSNQLELAQVSGYDGLRLSAWSATGSHMSKIHFAKSANATVGTLAATGNDEGLGFIDWNTVNNSSNSVQSAYIAAYQDATSTAYPAARIQFGTANGSSGTATRMTIKSDGNVGIGSTAPGELLEIKGDSSPAIKFIDTNGDNWRMGKGWAGGTTDEFWIANSTNLKFIITAAGDVGIGTDYTPDYKLDVQGDGRFDSNLSVGGTISAAAVSSASLAINNGPSIDGTDIDMNSHPITELASTAGDAATHAVSNLMAKRYAYAFASILT